MTDLDYGAFDALTFDCYGTLIDWESGILAGLRAMLAAHDADASDDEPARGLRAAEARLEAGQYLPYRTILASSGRTIAKDLGVAITDDEAVAFGDSVGAWPAFDDSTRSLKILRRRFRLGVLTNCDDELFAASNRRLGVEFDWVLTAQQLGATSRTRTTSRRSASASTTTGSPPGGSSTSPRACTTTTSRRSASASTPSGSTVATTSPAAGRPHRRMSTPTRRSRRWPPSRRPPFPGDGVDRAVRRSSRSRARPSAGSGRPPVAGSAPAAGPRSPRSSATRPLPRLSPDGPARIWSAWSCGCDGVDPDPLLDAVAPDSRVRARP